MSANSDPYQYHLNWARQRFAPAMIDFVGRAFPGFVAEELVRQVGAVLLRRARQARNPELLLRHELWWGRLLGQLFAACFSAKRPMLERYFRRRGLRDVADPIQDTSRAMWDWLCVRKGELNLGDDQPWLLVAGRVVADHWDRAARDPIVLSNGQRPTEHAGPSPEGRLDARQQLAAIAADQAACKAAAELLNAPNKPTNAERQRLFRCRGKLRRQLGMRPPRRRPRPRRSATRQPEPKKP